MEVPENLIQPVQLAGFVSRRSPRGNSRAANSTLHQSSHGFATRDLCFATKTRVLVRETPPAKQAKFDERKKVKLAELNSAHRRSQVNCLLFTNQIFYIKRIKLFLFAPHDKHLIKRGQSVCMRESSMTLLLLTSQRSVYVHDLAQTSPIQTSCSITKK